MATSKHESLSTGQLLAYSGLAMPLQILLIPLIVFLPTFYAQTGGVNAAGIAVIFFVARSWDAISDPIVGALSDRTKSQWGRRKPWIAIATPFLMLLTWQLLVPGDEVNVTQLGLTIFAFYVFWTMVQVPYISWGSEISPNYDERSRIASFREGGTVIGIAMGMGIPLLLIDPVAQPVRDILWPNGLPLDNSLTSLMQIMATTAIILLPITALLAVLFFPAERLQQKALPDWRQTLLVIKRNTIFRRLFTGFFTAQLGWLIFLSVVQLFIVQILQLKEYLLLVFLEHIVAILCVPLWAVISRKIGKHRAYCLSLFILISGLFALFWIPSGNLTLALIIFLYKGIGASGKLILPPAIAADTVDFDTMKTGSEEAGTHLALINFANKATYAISIGISFGLFALFGFDTQAGAQNTDDALLVLKLVATILPVVIMSAGLAVMWNFPLDRRKHAIIRKWLDRKAARA